jgi:hypothetical protein
MFVFCYVDVTGVRFDTFRTLAELICFVAEKGAFCSSDGCEVRHLGWQLSRYSVGEVEGNKGRSE